MEDRQSAFSENWSADEEKPPSTTVGKKPEQSTLGNKINCSSRLTVRALARGAASMAMEICRDR